MKDSCVKFLDTEDGFFCYFHFEEQLYDSNLVPIAFFAGEGNMESLGTRLSSFILLKPAIVLVSVNKKTARSWVRKC